MTTDTSGWHLKYRPQTLDDVLGQEAAVASLRGYKQLPHVIMCHGHTGAGKTTALRILADQLGCPEGSQDRYETNCAAVDSPLEYVKEMDGRRRARPMFGTPVRVYILDEVQSWSRSRGAQEALLKILEDCPPWDYYFLATTDPQKVIKPIHTRCAKIAFKPVPEAAMRKLLARVAKAEGVEFDAQAQAALVDAAGGSPRALLVEAERLAGIAPEARLGAVGRAGTEKAAFDLVKALTPFKGAPAWQDVSRTLDALKADGHDPEALRRLCVACAGGRLLKGEGSLLLAFRVVKTLSTPYYDAPTAWWFLIGDCYQVVHGK